MTKRTGKNGTKSMTKRTENAKKSTSNTMSLAKSTHTMVQPIAAHPRRGGRMPSRLLCFW